MVKNGNCFKITLKEEPNTISKTGTMAGFKSFILRKLKKVNIKIETAIILFYYFIYAYF